MPRKGLQSDGQWNNSPSSPCLRCLSSLCSPSSPFPELLPLQGVSKPRVLSSHEHLHIFPDQTAFRSPCDSVSKKNIDVHLSQLIFLLLFCQKPKHPLTAHSICIQTTYFSRTPEAKARTEKPTRETKISSKKLISSLPSPQNV